MRSCLAVKWAAFVVVLLGQVPVNAGEIGVFPASVLDAAFESGSGLFVVEVISQRQDEAGKSFFYKVRVLDAIVAGDIGCPHFSEPIEIFAGTAYGDKLSADGRYALFIRKEGLYWFLWTHRDDVIEIGAKSYYWPLAAKAKQVYNGSAIRAFREPEVGKTLLVPKRQATSAGGCCGCDRGVSGIAWTFGLAEGAFSLFGEGKEKSRGK